MLYFLGKVLDFEVIDFEILGHWRTWLEWKNILIIKYMGKVSAWRGIGGSGWEGYRKINHTAELLNSHLITGRFTGVLMLTIIMSAVFFSTAGLFD